MAPLTCMMLSQRIVRVHYTYIGLQMQLKSWPVEHCYPVILYRYIGCEYGMVAVLKYDAESKQIIHLPYCVPKNVIAGNCSILIIGWCHGCVGLRQLYFCLQIFGKRWRDNLVEYIIYSTAFTAWWTLCVNNSNEQVVI